MNWRTAVIEGCKVVELNTWRFEQVRVLDDEIKAYAIAFYATENHESLDAEPWDSEMVQDRYRVWQRKMPIRLALVIAKKAAEFGGFSVEEEDSDPTTPAEN